MSQNPPSTSRLNCHNFSETDIQAGSWGVKGKSEILAIFNKYKDTFDDLIDSLDMETPDWPNSLAWPRLIDKRSRNAPRSKSGSPTLSKDDCLDEDVPVMLAPKIQAFQMHHPHDVASPSPKSGKVQYGTLGIDKTALSTKIIIRKGLDVGIKKMSSINRLI